jgi:hypothetical protein
LDGIHADVAGGLHRGLAQLLGWNRHI